VRFMGAAWTALRFPQLSTRKSRRPQFLHNGVRFFCCEAPRSIREWVQRNVKLSVLPDDRQGQRQTVIPEGELPGDIGNARKRVLVARALRPPPSNLLLSRVGLLARRRLWNEDFRSLGSSNQDFGN
jgi:hypothetical protein